MQPYQKRALRSVAKFLFSRATHSPLGVDINPILFRMNLLETLCGESSVNAPRIYSLLSGIEDFPLAAALLESAKEQTDASLKLAYPKEPLSSLPHGNTFHDEKEFSFVQITGELCFTNLDSQIEAIRKARKITMQINSAGGCALTALRVADAMNGKEITATVFRRAYSAAVDIFQAATHRRICANANLMIHESRAAIFGTASELQDGSETTKSTNERLKKLFHRSPPALVEKWFASGDHWFTAQEALEVGLVDEIIPTPETPQQIFPDQTPVVAPLETDVDADAIKLSTEMLFRLRGTFSNKNRFNELLEKFTT